MDIYIWFYSNFKKQFVVGYWDLQFTGHATAKAAFTLFCDVLSNLNENKMILVWMNGLWYERSVKGVFTLLQDTSPRM